MLTGRRLFFGTSDPETVRNVVRKTIDPVSKFNTAVTPAVDAVVARALDRNPDRRTPSARALLEDIEKSLSAVDARVGPRDVALLVGLHLSAGPREAAPRTRLESLAQELGLESALELSLRFVISKREVSTALVGYSDLSQLESAIRWAERGPLTDDKVLRVLEGA